MGKADFGIQLENPGKPVFAGSTLVGKIWANIQSEISGTNFTLTFTGYERCKVRYTQSDSNGSKTRTATAGRTLVTLDVPVNGASMIQHGKIYPGKYTVPFEIEIPDVLPSSLEKTGGSGSCKIKYNLKAVLKGSGTVYDYSFEKDIALIAKPIDPEIKPYEGKPVQKSIKMCCCFDKGTMTFAARLSNSIVARNGTQGLQLSLSCRNHSTVDIESITAKITQKVAWKAHGHHASTHHTFARLSFDKNAIEGITAVNEAKQRGDSVRMENVAILDELRNEKHSQIFPVASLSSMENSYSGGCLSVEHILKINVQTPSNITNPSIEIKLRVCDFSDKPLPQQDDGGAEMDPGSSILPNDFKSDSVVVEPTLKIPQSSSTTGGKVYEMDTEIEINSSQAFGGGDDDDMLSSTMASGPSMQKLLKEMEISVADLEIVRKYLGDPSSRDIVMSVTPMNLSKMIQQVDSDFDQPRVAELVAENHSAFTCNHLIASIRVASDWNRSSMVEKLLQHCKDAKQNTPAVEAELTDWEKTVCGRVLKEYGPSGNYNTFG